MLAPALIPACSPPLPCPATQRANSWQEAEQAGKSVGFKLLDSRDVAQASPAATKPW